MFKLSALPS